LVFVTIQDFSRNWLKIQKTKRFIDLKFINLTQKSKMVQQHKLEKAFAVLGAIAGILTVCLQFVLFINSRTTSIGEVFIRFFSFFTILSNIGVGICFFANAFTAGTQMKFWKSAAVKTALLVYILVVGIVYNVVLRSLWEPVEWQKLVDEMLHVVMPLLFLLYWWWFAPKINFKWSNMANSLWYPFVYLIWVMLRGAFSNWYPYPFLDAFNHGYEKVAISSIVLLLVFGFLSILFFWGSSIKKGTPVKA